MFFRHDAPVKLTRIAMVVLALAACACGPSFQAVYEGNARFEHCYALEESPRVTLPEKGECWKDWSQRYTYGQTRDRVQYASARYTALTQATLPTDEAQMMAAPGIAPRVSAITAPAPTNAFAPPPKVLDEDAGGGPPERPRDKPRVIESSDAGNAGTAPILMMPGAPCEQGCQSGFRTCEQTCIGDAGKNACGACDRTFRGCMRGCFK